MKLAPTLLAFTVCAASAQPLPPPSRTVYKCEDGGKVHYSDVPCLGAQKLVVEPTRGLNKSSGKELVGQDVLTERRREALADALNPATGQTAEEFARGGRRTRLTQEGLRRCQQLDRDLPRAEAAEQAALPGEARRTAQQRLLVLRTAFRERRCE
jgi:hypothetical protein